MWDLSGGTLYTDPARFGQLLNALGHNHIRSDESAIGNDNFADGNADTYFRSDIIFERLIALDEGGGAHPVGV